MAAHYILNQQEIALKLKRMALEIAEQNTDANRIILAGIVGNGVIITQKLEPLLRPIFKGSIEQINIVLDKRSPTEITIAGHADLNNAVVILVDDVANSGRTFTYALKPLLNYFPQKIQTLALVNRTHKQFPIQPDYVGFSLSTTLQEYIEVEVKDGELTGAWIA